MTTEDWAIQLSPKLSDGTLVNIRATSPDHLDYLIEAVEQRAAKIAGLIGTIQAAGNVAPIAAPAAHQPPAPAQAAPAQQGWGQPQQAQAPGPQLGIEVETDRYGNRWEYNRPDAPDLPDGRGKYAYKAWTDKKGSARKAFVDPAKGPRPFPAGAAEAPIKWA